MIFRASEGYRYVTWGPSGFWENFVGISEIFRGFSVGFRKVTEALHRHFKGFRRVSGAMHGVRESFRGTSETFQETLENVRRVLDALRRRFRRYRNPKVHGSELVFEGLSRHFRKFHRSFTGFQKRNGSVLEGFGGSQLHRDRGGSRG